MEHTASQGWTMPGSVAARRIRSSIATLGVANTLHDVALRAANRVLLVKILRGVTIDRVNPAYVDCPEPYRPMFLDEARLREFSRDPANEMPLGFLEAALEKGDECYGFLAGDMLAAYGWYTSRPTRLEQPDLELRFSDRYVYMYKGFTHPLHRGQRLHAIGMTRALQHYLARGYGGLVSYVESNNFSSLKSCFRMGYVEFGSVYVLRIFGLYLTRPTAGCRPYRFRVEKTLNTGSHATALSR